MASSIVLSDNGVTSGSAGIKSTGGNDGVLLLQTTTSGGTATTAVTIDNAQNVGVGVTPSAWRSTEKTLQIGSAAVFQGRSDTLAANIASNWYVTTGGTNTYIATGNASLYQQLVGEHRWFNAPSGTAGNAITFTQAMTLDASGNLLVGTTSGSGEKFNVTGSVAGYLIRNYNSNANPYGCYYGYTAAAPNNTSNEFIRFDDTAAIRASIRSNGGLANYSANNVNLSDGRTKTDIQDAGGYLAKICAIPVRTFKYKDQTDDLLNLGVIAQEVEAVAPELVDVSGFGEMPEDGIPLKAIYQTDLQYALMKCIQEQQSLIQSLTDRLTALEGAAK